MKPERPLFSPAGLALVAHSKVTFARCVDFERSWSGLRKFGRVLSFNVDDCWERFCPAADSRLSALFSRVGFGGVFACGPKDGGPWGLLAAFQNSASPFQTLDERPVTVRLACTVDELERVSAMASIRLLVADDHDILRRGLRDLLEAQPGWSVIAEAVNGTEAFELALELKPDVAIVDVGMPDLNGFEATRRIREALPDTEVLILTAHDSEQLVHEAETSGARGYLLKSDVGRDLLAAVESARRHKFFLSPQIAERSPAAPGRNGQGPSLPRLTAREREIIQLLAEGHINKDIATRLNISVKTAETHRTNIMRKIDVHSLPDLTRFAIRNHLVEP